MVPAHKQSWYQRDVFWHRLVPEENSIKSSFRNPPSWGQVPPGGAPAASACSLDSGLRLNDGRVQAVTGW